MAFLVYLIIMIIWLIIAIPLGYRLGFVKSLLLGLVGSGLIFLVYEAMPSEFIKISPKLLSLAVFGPFVLGGILSIFFIYSLRLGR